MHILYNYSVYSVFVQCEALVSLVKCMLQDEPLAAAHLQMLGQRISTSKLVNCMLQDEPLPTNAGQRISTSKLVKCMLQDEPLPTNAGAAHLYL